MKVKVVFLLGFVMLGLVTLSSARPDKMPNFGRVEFDFSNTASPNYQMMIQRLDSLYLGEEARGFSGSVLIGYKGKIIYEKYMGYSDKENGIKWNKNTISQLASTSKPLTSAAILVLADKGLLYLDSPVAKYIKDFPYPEITVRLLLTHRSGLRDYVDKLPAKSGKSYLDNDDIVEYFVSKKPSLEFTPNTKHHYCNSNFALLASVVEQVSGMRFKYFMERFIFKKLGMNQTEIHDPNVFAASNVAKSYKAGWVHYKDNQYDGVWGDKGVYSTVRDLYKWDQSLYSNSLLKWSTIQEAFKPYSFETPGGRNYGLGWRMLLYPEGTKVIYHNGWWHGNNTCFYRFINDNFSIIVLGNKYSTNIYKQPQKIFNILNNVQETNLPEDDEGE